MLAHDAECPRNPIVARAAAADLRLASIESSARHICAQLDAEREKTAQLAAALEAAHAGVRVDGMQLGYLSFCGELMRGLDLPMVDGGEALALLRRALEERRKALSDLDALSCRACGELVVVSRRCGCHEPTMEVL